MAVGRFSGIPSIGFCTKCGGQMAVLFNVARCWYGCSGPAPAPLFSSFWSAYSGLPRFLRDDEGDNAQERFDDADVVVAFAYVNGGSQSIEEVFVVKNNTWDSLVGQWVKISASESAIIGMEAEASTSSISKDFNLHTMICLVRA